MLDYFGVEAPPFVADVYPRVTDMLRKKGSNPPVVAGDGRLKGLLTTGDLAHYLPELGLSYYRGLSYQGNY